MHKWGPRLSVMLLIAGLSLYCLAGCSSQVDPEDEARAKARTEVVAFFARICKRPSMTLSMVSNLNDIGFNSNHQDRRIELKQEFLKEFGVPMPERFDDPHTRLQDIVDYVAYKRYGMGKEIKQEYNDGPWAPKKKSAAGSTPSATTDGATKTDSVSGAKSDRSSKSALSKNSDAKGPENK